MADDLGSRIKRAVALLNKRRILVGIPSDAKQTEPVGKSAPPLWLIGYINEFGDDELHIPPRPFLVPGVESQRKEIERGLRKAAEAAFSGDIERADALLDYVAETAKAGAKSMITNGSLPALSPKTIYKRQHRKGPPKTLPPVMRTSPLIDQGDLLRSIVSVVEGR